MTLLGFLLQIVIFVCALYDGVEFIKPEMGTASLTVTDIVVTAVYIVWLFLFFGGRFNNGIFSRNKSLIVFIGILLLPIPIGMLEGHLWQTVMREARAPYYYGLSLVVASYVKDEKTLLRLVRSLQIVGVLFLLWGYAVYIFKIPIATNLNYTWLKSGRTTRHFGYHSSHLLMLVCIMLLTNYLLASSARFFTKSKAAVLAVLFVIGQLLTMIRGLFLGMVGGVALTLLLQQGRGKWKMIAISGVVVLIGLSLAFVVSMANPDLKGDLLSVPVVERYWSIVDRSVTTELSAKNAAGRENAIGRINKDSTIFGAGYGDLKKWKYSELVDPIQGLISHSGPSWMLYRTGYFGFVVLHICLIMFLIKGFKSFRRSETVIAKTALGGATASLLAIYITSFAANMMFGSERFSPLIAIVIGLILSPIERLDKPKNNAIWIDKANETALAWPEHCRENAPV